MFQGTTIKQLNCTKTDKVFVKEEEVFDSIDAQHKEKGQIRPNQSTSLLHPLLATARVRGLRSHFHHNIHFELFKLFRQSIQITE